MNYLESHDKYTIEEADTNILAQTNYRYKTGDLMVTVPHAVFRFGKDIRGGGQTDHGHWTPVDTTSKDWLDYTNNEYRDNLALVVYYFDGCENLSGGIGSEVDYIFTKTRNIYLSKSRTAKLRLGVKPAKVVREEEEEEDL